MNNTHNIRNWGNIAERKEVQVYVGRKSTTVPSDFPGADGRYGNPYIVDVHGTREEVVALYKKMLFSDTPFAIALRKEITEKLKGKILGCWCAPRKCHAEIIAPWLIGTYLGNLRSPYPSL